MDREDTLIPGPPRYLVKAARWLVLCAVTIGIAFFVRRSWEELTSASFRFRDLRWGWLLIGVVSYTAGMFPFWLFWHRVLIALGQQPSFLESSRAFFVGHLGKYVPGKAMVVVMRSAMVRSERTHPTIAATAVFIETLTMMAVGAFVAAACLLPQMRDYPGLIVLAIGLMLVAGTPTAPPIFRRLVAILQVQRAAKSIEASLDGLSWRLMASGWILMIVGWFLFGFSLYATLSAMPGAKPSLGDIPRLTGGIALAIVAGFVSLLPAGIGIRELILLPLLGIFGSAKAIACVVLARLGWLISELTVSGIFYIANRQTGPKQDGSKELDEHREQLSTDTSSPPTTESRP